MKVLDLQCAHQHAFEGWFACEDDYRQQLETGLLACPICGDTDLHKLPSAPRLNLGCIREPDSDSMSTTPALAEQPKTPTSQGSVLQALRELVHKTEDVGERFADEARAMHLGDAEQRPIRGRTTPEVALELMEDGIDVLPLPNLSLIKETLQ